MLFLLFWWWLLDFSVIWTFFKTADQLCNSCKRVARTRLLLRQQNCDRKLKISNFARFHGCQHAYYQIHSSRLSNARGTMRNDATHQCDNASTAGTELALCGSSQCGRVINPVGPSRTPTVLSGRYDGRPWVARLLHTSTQRKDARHAGIRAWWRSDGCSSSPIPKKKQDPTEFFCQDRWRAEEIRQRVGRLRRLSRYHRCNLIRLSVSQCRKRLRSWWIWPQRLSSWIQLWLRTLHSKQRIVSSRCRACRKMCQTRCGRCRRGGGGHHQLQEWDEHEARHEGRYRCLEGGERRSR